MSAELDDLYLEWLYHQISSDKSKNPARTYWELARQLYSKEFIWFVPNDDNRIEDGKELRYEFIDDRHIDAETDWMELGCSMLELLVGLSRRLAFEAEGKPRDWFWEMLTNIGINSHNDKSGYSPEEVDEILNAVIFRTHQPNGQGGLFPLQHPDRDQRRVEIWYQLSAYLLERD